MQEQVTNQQQEINRLQNVLEEKRETIQKDPNGADSTSFYQDETRQIQSDDNGINKSFAAIKDVIDVELRDGISGLSIKGDVRYRYENQQSDIFVDEDGTPGFDDFNGDGIPDRVDRNRDRQRIRLRIGALWTNPDENWEFGAGLVTGGDDATSANDTFSDGAVFETGDIRLDYAYIKHSWENIDLIIGQQINPWKDSITLILWDSDVRPIGITGKVQIDDGPFLTTGIYDVFHHGRDEADALLATVRAGYLYEGLATDFFIAAGYWWFNSATVDDGNTVGDATDNSPGIPDGISNDFDFNIGDIYSHFLVFSDLMEIKFYGHLLQNFGADGSLGTGQRLGTINPPKTTTLPTFLASKLSLRSLKLELPMQALRQTLYMVS